MAERSPYDYSYHTQQASANANGTPSSRQPVRSYSSENADEVTYGTGVHQYPQVIRNQHAESRGQMPSGYGSQLSIRTHNISQERVVYAQPPVPGYPAGYTNVPSWPAATNGYGNTSEHHAGEFAWNAHSQTTSMTQSPTSPWHGPIATSSDPLSTLASTTDGLHHMSIASPTPVAFPNMGFVNASPSPTVPEPPVEISVTCRHCGKVLTGPHANGNLTRHQKSQDCASNPRRREYHCSEKGCEKTYQRSDGLLNHMRKAHNAPGPLKRNPTDETS